MLSKHRVELTGIAVDETGQQTASGCWKGARSMPQRRAHGDGCSLPPGCLAYPLWSGLCPRDSGQEPGVGGRREPHLTADELSGNQRSEERRGGKDVERGGRRLSS